jgi:hypothetical protein
MEMFRRLTDTEAADFRQYATVNDPPNLADWNLYHPVCREVWIARGFAPQAVCTCVEPPNDLNGQTHDADCPQRYRHYDKSTP